MFFLGGSSSAASHGVAGAGAFLLLGRGSVSVAGAEGGDRLEGTGYGGRRQRLWTSVFPFWWITSATAPAGGTLRSRGGPPAVSNKRPLATSVDLLWSIMERPLSVLVALVLVSFCKGWDAPEFCHGQPCPEYQLVQKTQDFEERLYVATSWITTDIKTNNGLGVMAANSRLKTYCKKHNDAGQDVPIRVDTWPALLNIEGSLSWFIPPGTLPEITDESVRLETRPKATVYVRVFGGTPDLNSGNDAAKELRDALTKAGKSYDLLTFSGAAYDPYFSLDHHNEVWIYAV